MNKRHELGKKGEKVAEKYLNAQRFTIKDRNYRHSRAEIDLICKKNDYLIFVEVKTRSGTLFGYPEEFVTPGQMERIALAAVEYMRKKSYSGKYRHDIIAIVWQGNSYTLSHFEDAF
jgi:putative endonuclease